MVVQATSAGRLSCPDGTSCYSSNFSIIIHIFITELPTLGLRVRYYFFQKLYLLGIIISRMAATRSKIGILLIACFATVGRVAPCYYIGNWPYEDDQDCHVHVRQVGPPEKLCPIGFQFYDCAASGDDSCCSVDPCGLLRGICPSSARIPNTTSYEIDTSSYIISSSSLATASSETSIPDISTSTLHSASTLSSTTQFASSDVLSESSHSFVSLIISPQSVTYPAPASPSSIAGSAITRQAAPSNVGHSQLPSPVQPSVTIDPAQVRMDSYRSALFSLLKFCRFGPPIPRLTLDLCQSGLIMNLLILEL